MITEDVNMRDDFYILNKKMQKNKEKKDENFD